MPNIKIFESDLCKFEKNRLILSEDVSKDEWVRIGEGLKFLQGSVQFWIGDWARFGEKKGYYTDSKTYDEIQKHTGLSRGTIREYKYVAQKVPVSSRLEDVSFEHHHSVAALPLKKQKIYLLEAKEKNLSVKQFRLEIKEDRLNKRGHQRRVKTLRLKENNFVEPGLKMRSFEEICDIRKCDLKNLVDSGIKPDCIITEPPQSEIILHVYGVLAWNAKTAKVPVVAVIAEQSYLPELFKEMCLALKYRWMLSYPNPGGEEIQIQKKKIISSWKPLVIFGRSEKWIEDAWEPTKNSIRNCKREHSEDVLAYIIEKLTKPGQLVCDPFIGTGATAMVSLRMGRRFIGCDMEQNSVDSSIKRCEDEYKKIKNRERKLA